MTSKMRLALFGVPVVIVALSGTFAIADTHGGNPQLAGRQHATTHRILTGGPLISVRRNTDTLPFTTSSTSFVLIPNSISTVSVPAQSSRLINVRFTAESACSESGGVGESNWCKIRILIGGVEAYPQNELNAPSTLAFDSTDDGTESSSSWESHTTEGARCIKNTSTQAISIRVVVQAAVTNLGGDADLPVFWLDDRTLDTSVYNRCSG